MMSMFILATGFGYLTFQQEKSPYGIKGDKTKVLRMWIFIKGNVSDKIFYIYVVLAWEKRKIVDGSAGVKSL